MRNLYKVVFFLCFGCNQISAQTLNDFDSLLTDNNQVVFVLTKDWNTIEGMMFLYERENVFKEWVCVQSFPVVVGRSGLAWDETNPIQQTNLQKIKKEGDGNTPAGIFTLGPVFGYDFIAELKMPYAQVDEHDLCVDDLNSMYYNRLIDADTIQEKDYASFENMKRKDALYEIGIWVNYNSTQIIPGNGSCIFLHIWRDEKSPTSGCTAMSKENMQTVIHWLDEQKKPVLFQTCFK